MVAGFGAAPSALGCSAVWCHCGWHGEKAIAARIEERKKIRAEILQLSKQRDAYIAAERKKLGQTNGFDTAVAQALKEQLLKKGIK